MPAPIPTLRDLQDQPYSREWLDALGSAAQRHVNAAEALMADGADLKASEQRAVDAHIREATGLTELHNQSKPTTAPVSFGPDQPSGATVRTTDDRILRNDQSVAEWTRRNRPGRHDNADLSLTKYLRGWITGDFTDAEAEQRVLAEGATGSGGALIPTPLSATIIDRARNHSRVIQAGARTIPMTSQTLRIPRLTGSATPAWRSENAAIGEDNLTFDAVTFTARSLAIIVRCSRELLDDSDPSVADVVANDLGRQVATELDRVALLGSGTAPEPRGVRNQSGVTQTAFGGVNGGPFVNYDPLLDALQVLRGSNFEPNGIILSPRVENTLSKLKETSTGAYLAPPAQLRDIPRYSTNQVPINGTTGTSSDTTDVYTADWTQLMIGMRTELQLHSLVERYADVGQVGFLVWVRADVQLSHPGAFSVTTGVR